MKIKIAPSILSADREKLQEEVKEIEPYADLIHVDVMDGKFVPPTTFKAEEIKKIHSKLVKDVHLMVNNPLKDGFVDDYIDAGADSITIQVESEGDTDECLDYIKKKGVKAAITLNPGTPLEKILPYLDKVDMVLIMSVNPGYAGQAFMLEVLDKVKVLREKFPDLDIQIDGGITKETIKGAAEAGANIFVAGSAIFGEKDRKRAIEELRQELENFI